MFIPVSVLGIKTFNFSTPMADRDRTENHDVLNPAVPLLNWRTQTLDLLQPQSDERHRGAKHPRRYGLWRVSACYPRRTFYPLSDGPPLRTTDTMTVRPRSTCQSAVRQAYAIALTNDF